MFNNFYDCYRKAKNIKLAFVADADGGPMPSTALRSQVESEIGRRIRLRRAILGLSQKQLGGAIGLTPQQVQKYEKGTNRIAASTLFAVAEALEVPVAHFFDGLLEPRARPEAASGLLIERRETLDLLRAYRRLDDAKVRRHFIDFVRHIARLAVREPA